MNRKAMKPIWRKGLVCISFGYLAVSGGGIFPAASFGQEEEGDAIGQEEIGDLLSEPGVEPEENLTEKRASYRLGPGDVLGIRLRGQEDPTGLAGVAVGPDGTISYLQATKLKVNGMTIPEARAAIEEKLAEFYRDPIVIITPQGLESKSYSILGMVRKNGIFPITEPVKLLDAIALSGGLTTAALPSARPDQPGSRLSVDFARSFIVRDSKKLAIDFEKLYVRGDLTDNIRVKAGDYIYIASNNRQTCYALGAVSSPGSLLVAEARTVMGLIAQSGGYGPGAWKQKILLVRGSLAKPEVTVVDTGEILKGKARDVPVEAGDIIFVNTRPWYFAEQLLDTAINSFIRGIVSGAIDQDARVGVSDN